MSPEKSRDLTGTEPTTGPTGTDPGFDAAARRARAVLMNDLVIPRTANGGAIRVGTAGWTDPTLIAPGVFYPQDAGSPDRRLRYYASRFPLVETDASFYALPARRNAELWVIRTPRDFVFDVKAHALMTGHPTEIKRLPRDLQDALPADVVSRGRVYPHDLPSEIMDEVWRLFVDALQPLAIAGKLGPILLQFPPWFLPTRDNLNTIIAARDRLAPLPVAVELRNRRWFTPRVGERTFAQLRDNALPYVVVDEPQGTENSVPPIVSVTASALAVVRMHGRRSGHWNRRGATVSEKYRYLYSRGELEEWVPKILEVSEHARDTHVVFNNCYGNYGTTNALEMIELLWQRTYQSNVR
jgi:uncharacterized protein YecE (DUF72 family)